MADATGQNWQFAVGQVLFVVLLREHNVLPVQVIEENRRTVLGGTIQVTYTVQLRSADDSPTLELDHTLHEVFESIDALRAALRMRAATAVDGLVDRARVAAQTAFPAAALEPAASSNSAVDGEKNELTQLVLPGGTVVKARITGPTTAQGR